MSRGRGKPDQVLVVYDDLPRGIALLHGRKVKQLLASAGLVERAIWSNSGAGWVITTKDVADLVACAQWLHVPCLIKNVGETTAAEQGTHIADGNMSAAAKGDAS